MPNTPILALPYPAATDPADVPFDIKKLADRLDIIIPTLLKPAAYAEVTASVGISATTAATAQPVVTAPSLNADGSTVYEAQFYADQIAPAANLGGAVFFHLWDGSTDTGIFGVVGAGAVAPVNLVRRLTPAAGAHIFSIRSWQSGGNGSVYAGPGGVGVVHTPAWLRVRPVLV